MRQVNDMASTLTFAVPVSWDNSNAYEVNTIVFVGKRAYTAIQNVPTGIAITNTDYWIETGVKDIDVEAIETALAQLQDDVDANETAIAANTQSITTNANNITALTAQLATAVNSITANAQRLDNIMITLYTPVSS